MSKRDEELGKGLIALANMLFVLFLLNNVLLSGKNDNVLGVAITSMIALIICVLLYVAGYEIIKKSEGQ
jgi:hypothetical protein